MKVVTTLDDLRTARRQLNGSIGLVPTMGYLHDGHLSLVHNARLENSSVVATIFVNPTQFGPSEDLGSYPRDLPRDLALLENAGVDLVWTPTPEDMYPPHYQTWVNVEQLTGLLEGGQRPGHFRGVTTVVAKLFNSVQPTRAYFGQKDAQQAVVIRRMVMDLNFPIEIVVCPIVREPDGLAMSSRNTYLDEDQRQAATVLYRALTAAAQAYERGEHSAQALRERMLRVLSGEQLAQPQYVSVANPVTLQELEGDVDQALLSMAVFVGKTRLIDNMLLGLDSL
ncbi:MAG: pantoate--beta-alanine ligase [Anaerolineales bacterium]